MQHSINFDRDTKKKIKTEEFLVVFKGQKNQLIHFKTMLQFCTLKKHKNERFLKGSRNGTWLKMD